MADAPTFFVSDLEMVDLLNRNLYEPDPSGGYRLRGVKRLPEMGEADKRAFIEKHGLPAFARLVRESLPSRENERPVGPFKSAAESSAYREANGHDAWMRKIAASRR